MNTTQSISQTKTNTVGDVVASVKSRNLKVNFLPTNQSVSDIDENTKLPKLGKGSGTNGVNMP